MKPLHRITAQDVLEPDEIERVNEIFTEAGHAGFAKRCIDEIIVPVLPRIKGTLGYAFDVWMLAYAFEYGLMVAARTTSKRKGKAKCDSPTRNSRTPSQYPSWPSSSPSPTAMSSGEQ